MYLRIIYRAKYMDLDNRRRQMTRLCNWLIDGLGLENGSNLADAVKISQSTISGHLAENPDAATPNDALKEKYCKFMLTITTPQKMVCSKWTTAAFTEYLDSRMTPEAFVKYLNQEKVPIERSMVEVNESLTDSERLELLVIMSQDLAKSLDRESNRSPKKSFKKDRVLAPSYA